MYQERKINMKKKEKYKNLREIVDLAKEDVWTEGMDLYATLDATDIKELRELLEDYDYFKCIEELRENRKYYKKYLKERRKEEPNLLYPDFDEVYQRYFEQKDKIEELEIAIQGLIVRDNGVNFTYNAPLNTKKKGKK